MRLRFSYYHLLTRQKGTPLKTSRISEGILEHALSALTAWENDGVSLDDCLDDLRAFPPGQAEDITRRTLICPVDEFL